MYLRSHILSATLFVCIITRAQTDGILKKQNYGFLRSTQFCQPFVSEVENYRTQIEVNYASNCEEYDLSNSGKALKVFQNTTIGCELPYFTKIYSQNNKPIWGFGLNTVLSFHLWWDPLEVSTSPVLNTDYRFGSIQFKLIKFLENKTLKNISVKIAPFNHESTHIGDELTLYRIRKDYPITRVNVSYEYSEFHLTLNDPNGEFENNQSLRFGYIYRINGSQDYYTVSKNEGDSTLARPTGMKSEFYAEYNMTFKNKLTPFNKWITVFSFEFRNRARYNYPTYCTSSGNVNLTEIPDKRENTLNAYFGLKYIKKNSPTLGIYIHGYYGINPYGQFRNRYDFKSLGLSFILE